MSEQQWSDLTQQRVKLWSEQLKKDPGDIFSGIKQIMDQIDTAKKAIGVTMDRTTLENKARFEWYRREKSGFGGAAQVLFEGIIWGPTEAFDMTGFQRWRQIEDYNEADIEGKQRMIREGRIRLEESPNEVVEGKPKLIPIALDTRKHFDASNTAVEPTNPNYGKPLVPVWRRKVAGLCRPAGEEPGPWRPTVIQLFNEDCFASLLKDGTPNFLQQLVDGFYDKHVAFNARIRNAEGETDRWLLSLPQGNVMSQHPGIKHALIPDNWTTDDDGKVKLFSGAPKILRRSLSELTGLFNAPAPDENSPTPFQAYCKDYDRVAVMQVQVISKSDRHIGIGNNYLMTVEEPNVESFESETFNVWVNDELASKYNKFGEGSIIELVAMPRSGRIYDRENAQMTEETALQFNAYDMVAYPEWKTEPRGTSPAGAEEVSSQ